MSSFDEKSPWNDEESVQDFKKRVERISGSHLREGSRESYVAMYENLRDKTTPVYRPDLEKGGE